MPRPVDHFPVRATTTSLRLAIVLTALGGYLDAYSYLHLDGVFTNTQTGNIVLLAVRGADGQWSAALRNVAPILAFVVGVAVAELLRLRRRSLARNRPARVVLGLELVVLVVVGFLPGGFPPAIVVIALSFAAALQGTMFVTVQGWTYTSTLSTANLRTMSAAVMAAVADRDHEATGRAVTFALLVGAFLAGALVGAVLTLHLYAHASWPAAGLPAVGMAFYLLE